MAYVLAIDAGTTGVGRSPWATTARRWATPTGSSPSTSPQPGWVEHDAEEIWAVDRGGVRRGRRRGTGRPRGHRHHQPAGDGRGVVPRRPAGRCAPGHRVAGPPHRRPLRRAAGGRRTLDTVRAPHRAGARPVLLRHQGGVAAASAGRRADERRRRPRHHRQLAGVEADRRRRPRHRAVQRQPHDALRHRRAPPGRRELCDLLGVPDRGASPRSARRSATSAATTGGLAGVPIAGILGDQQSALFGQACLSPGMAKNTYGTGSFVAGQRRRDRAPSRSSRAADHGRVGPRATAGGSPTPSKGAIFVTGAAVQWLRDGLGVIDDGRRHRGPRRLSVDRQRRPRRGPRLHRPRLAVVGPLRPGHRPRHHPRLDRRPPGPGDARGDRPSRPGTSLESMAAAGGVPIADLRVDGGATANGLLLQLVADQLGIPVTRPAIAETTALGAAYAAGLGVGIWSTHRRHQPGLAGRRHRRPDAARRRRAYATVATGGPAQPRLGAHVGSPP